jgi:hypothetical protein
MRAGSTSTLVAVMLHAAFAHAIDRPVAAVKLLVKRSSSGKEKIVFVSRDRSFLFPGIGTPDDPGTGSPGGAMIELLSQNEGIATLVIPPGAGNPGWVAKAGTTPSHKFTNKLAPSGSPIRTAQLKQGKVLKLVGRSTGLPLVGAQGTVGIRITTGSLRNCALFDGATIRKDLPNLFDARGATASGLADCSTGSLGVSTCTAGSFGGDECGGSCPPGSLCGTRDLNTCLCISSADPCGDTYPVCNGTCPPGDECLPSGGFPLPSCACLPAGSTPCTQFQCGGACSAGLECNYFEISTPGGSGCSCGPPGPCGSGGDDCPSGFHCTFGPGIGPLCWPNS